MKLHLLAFFLAGLCAAGALAEDVVTLTDGRSFTGTIVKEDADGVVLQQQDGKLRVLLNARIAKIERGQEAGNPAGGANNGGSKSAGPENAKAGPGLKNITLEDIKALGSPNLEVRKAAMDKFVAKGPEVVPGLLGMLHPKYPADEGTRLSILRVLAKLAPLGEQGSRTLAYDALHDPYPEVRREACCVIRQLDDDTAARELGKLAATEDISLRYALAGAIHEIDDSRLLYALVAAIPQPTTDANVSNVTGTNNPKYLPIGPMGSKIPIFLPSEKIAGTSTDVGSPVAELLKLIANKNLGSSPAAWLNWYREKMGDLSSNWHQFIIKPE